LRTSLIAVFSFATIAAGVFGGATRAFQVSDLKADLPHCLCWRICLYVACVSQSAQHRALARG
jgi:hypothetical protein